MGSRDKEDAVLVVLFVSVCLLLLLQRLLVFSILSAPVSVNAPGLSLCLDWAPSVITSCRCFYKLIAVSLW